MKEIILDCSLFSCKAQLHQALFEALALPQWYGHNLDALFDCLTELPEEIHLILKNWSSYTDDRKGFEAVFADAADGGFFHYTLA